MNCCNDFGQCQRGKNCPIGERLPGPAPLPDIEADPGREEAVAFYQGMWTGIAIGGFIGAGLIVLGLGAIP